MYQARRRLKDYKDVPEVEQNWRVIQLKVVSDVKEELAQWTETADTLADQNQIQQAQKILDQFAQMKFSADLFKEFHRNFQLVEQGSKDADA